MTHANCGCCCDNSLPLIGPTLPTGPFFEYLNATGALDQGPLVPQRFNGQGFALHSGTAFDPARASEAIARGGVLSFPDFKGSVIFAQTAADAPGTLGVIWTATLIGAQPEGATITVQWGPHTASSGGPLVTGSSFFVVSKTLSLDGVQLPLDGVGMPAGTTQNPSLQLYRTRITDSLAIATATDVLTSPVNFCAVGAPTFLCRDGANVLHYYRTATQLIRESSGDSGQKIRQSLDGRIVIARDNADVDRLRPSGPQYESDTASDGSYVVSKYFGRENDDPNKVLLWPPRPERVVSSFAKDTTPPKYGFLTPNDHYIDEGFDTVGVGGQVSSRTYLYATKPYSVGVDDESIPGAAVRPRLLTSFGAAAFDLHINGSGLQRTIGLRGPASLNGYRDIFGQSPASLPVVPWRFFPVPGGGKGPRPVLDHPAGRAREPYRPLAQSEQVAQVDLTFSEDVVVSGVTAQQVQLTVDGVSVGGCTIAPMDSSQRQFTVGVPTGPQVEGSFCVLTYDPAGEVVSDTENQRPAQLAARTSWMMQKPYKRDPKVAVGERIFDIGRTASLSATGPVGPSEESLNISLTQFAHIAKHNFGTVEHRPNQDLFSPQMPFDATGPTGPTGQAGPSDCSYYGMATTIFPCPPAALLCPMPRLPQPHNSAFRHGRGSGSIAVTLSGTLFDQTVIDTSTVKEIDSLALYGPLTFAATCNGNQMPQGTWALATSFGARTFLGSRRFFVGNAVLDRRNKVFLDRGTIEGAISAVRSVTEYPQLKTAYAWNLVLAMTLKISHTYSTEIEMIGSGNPPPTPEPFTIVHTTNEFYAAVTALEELAGTVVRQPFEYGFAATPLPGPGTFRAQVDTTGAFSVPPFVWHPPGTPTSQWPLGTVQVDF